MARNQKSILGLSLSAVGLMMALGYTPVRGQPPATMETVKQAWKERQERAKTLRFNWTERTTIPKGHLSNKYAKGPLTPKDLEKMGMHAGAVIPPQDTTFDLASYACFEGDKIRLDRDRRLWSGKENGFIFLPTVSAFDGKFGTNLHPKGGVESSFPQANIQRGYRGEIDGPALTAIVLSYRPFLHQISRYRSRCNVIDW